MKYYANVCLKLLIILHVSVLKNVELIERLQEYHKEVAVSINNNEVLGQPSSTTSSAKEKENEKQCLITDTSETDERQLPIDNLSKNQVQTSSPPSSPTSSTGEVENGKDCLDNVTFEIVNSKIPTDEHVHIRRSDHSASEIADEEVCSNLMDNNSYDFPDSTSTDHKVEQKSVPVSRAESHSETVFRELNCRVTLTGL